MPLTVQQIPIPVGCLEDPTGFPEKNKISSQPPFHIRFWDIMSENRAGVYLLFGRTLN